jgi:hypothetical protein
MRLVISRRPIGRRIVVIRLVIIDRSIVVIRLVITGRGVVVICRTFTSRRVVAIRRMTTSRRIVVVLRTITSCRIVVIRRMTTSRRVVAIRRMITSRGVVVIRRMVVAVDIRMIKVRRRHRTAYGPVSRPSPVHRRKVFPVAAGVVLVRHLLRRRLQALLAHGRLLLAVRPGVDAVRPIKACPIDHRRIVDNRSIDIRVVDNGGVHMHHRGVIGEMSAFPASAVETRTAVAIAIVHSTVEADVGSPVPGVPQVNAATPTPIPRGPKNSRPGSHDPGSRNPEVALFAISPVSRSPKVSITGANRLRVYRQDGRSDRYGNKHARKRRSWHYRHQ